MLCNFDLNYLYICCDLRFNHISTRNSFFYFRLIKKDNINMMVRRCKAIDSFISQMKKINFLRISKFYYNIIAIPSIQLLVSMMNFIFLIHSQQLVKIIKKIIEKSPTSTSSTIQFIVDSNF